MHWNTDQLFHTINTTPRFLLAILLSTVVFALVMVVLHYSSLRVKKWTTIVCTFLAGLFFILDYVLPVHQMKDKSWGNSITTPYVESVSNFFQYVIMWTIGLGLISLALVHGRRLLRQANGWHHSLAFFIAAIVMLIFGFASRTGSAGSSDAKMYYDSLFSGLLINLDSAIFCLLAFYIASAAYRAFRVRTVEAALLMISALLVMLGLVNFGVMLTNWIPTDSGWAYFRIERLSAWLLQWINMPAYRAVTIGVAVGALAMAMRMWLSLERGVFFTQE